MEDFFKGLALGLVLSAWICMFGSKYIREPRIEKEWHDEAVRRGHAVYYVDGETMERKWRWLNLEEMNLEGE